MIRDFIGKRELFRSIIIKFATTIFTLQQIYQQTNNLSKMFTSKEWTHSKWAKESAGKRTLSLVI